MMIELNRYHFGCLSVLGKLSGVYLLMQREVVLYVGRSNNLVPRVLYHNKKLEYDSVGFVICDEIENVMVESALIDLLRPLHNRTIFQTTTLDRLEALKLVFEDTAGFAPCHIRDMILKTYTHLKWDWDVLKQNGIPKRQRTKYNGGTNHDRTEL